MKRRSAWALVAALALGAVVVAGAHAAPDKKEKDPVAEAEAAAAKRLKSAAKAAKKQAKATRKAIAREAKTISRALTTGQGLDDLLPAAHARKKSGSSVELASAEEFGALTHAIGARVNELDDRVRIAYVFHSEFVEVRDEVRGVEGAPTDAGRPGWGEPFDDPRLEVDAELLELVQFLREVTPEFAEAIGISEEEFRETFALDQFPLPPVSTETDEPFTQPVPVNRVTDSTGNVDLYLHAPPPPPAAPPQWLQVYFEDADGNLVLATTVALDGDGNYVASAEGLLQDLVYRGLIEVDDGNRKWCIDAGSFRLPARIAIPDDGGPGDTQDCVVEDGCELLYDISSGAPTEIQDLDLSGLTLTEFLNDPQAAYPRIVVSTDLARLYYVEFGFFDSATGASAFVAVDFGQDGVPLAANVPFGAASPGSSFFSSFPPDSQAAIDLASPISPDHELRGSICLDAKSIKAGSKSASVSVEFIGDLIDRMGDRDVVVGSISGRMGHVGAVTVETE